MVVSGVSSFLPACPGFPMVSRMFRSISLGNQTLTSALTPALFLAPMAGVTHSAFRRLLSDFGGYGALFTEMISASAFLHERSDISPFTKRRECEGPVIFQFRISGAEDVEAVIAKAAALEPAAIDLNLGCPAPRSRTRPRVRPSSGISIA